jgi:hypothetical protein
MKFLDAFFTLFHTSLILFILFGWIWKRSRKLNLACILLTASSWLFLGIFYGIGYCPLTDWHFKILERLGHTNLPNSYIRFLITRLTGLEPRQGLVDAFTAWGLILALAASLYTNFRMPLRRLLKKIRKQEF